MRGLLDTVGASAEIDRVEIVLEDFVLRLLLVDLESQHGFADLARDRRGRAHIVALDILLGECRSALAGQAPQVVQGGPRRTAQVDAGVLVESLILGRDNSMGHEVRQGIERDGRAPDLRIGPDLGLAVRIEHVGRLGESEVIRLGNLSRQVKVGEGAHTGGDDEKERAEDEAPRGQPAADRTLSPTRVVP